MNSGSKNISVVFFFILAFLWVVFLTEGLPFQFGDDLVIIDIAKGTPWAELLKRCANPLSPAWYVIGSENALTTRPLHTLIAKGLFSLFHYRSEAFYVLKAVAFGVATVIIFNFVYAITASSWAAAGAALFFISTPPTYLSIQWISDLEIVAQCFIALALYFFYRLSYSHEKWEARRWITNLLFMAASAWIGIKIKESAKMIPFVIFFGIFLIEREKILGWLKEGRNRILALAAFSIFILVIPFAAGQYPIDPHTHSAISDINFSNLISAIFHNPQGLEPSQVPALFSLKKEIPSTLTATFGFFLSWIFLVSAVVLIPKEITKRREERRPEGIYLVSAWFLVALLGFVHNIKLYERYLVIVLVPSSILIFSCFHRFLLLFSRPVKIILGFFVGILTLAAAQTNIDHTLFLRNYYGGLDIANYRQMKAIFQDRYGNKAPSYEELFDFYIGRPPYRPLEFRSLRVTEWEEAEKPDADLESVRKRAAEWGGAAYVASYNSDLYALSDKVTILTAVSQFSDSIYSRLVWAFKKKKRPTIYVYKVMA